MITNSNLKATSPFVPTNRRTAIHLVQSSVLAQRIAKLLVYGLFASVIGMMVLPWQQTSRGDGQVVAYAPQERQQTIQSQVEGVVSYIAEGMAEGVEVEEGQIILEIEPVADTLKSQVEAQINDLKEKKATFVAKAEAHGREILRYQEARDFAVEAARDMVESTQSKLEAERQLIPGYEAKLLQAKQNYDRQERLSKGGWQAEKEVEKRKADLEFHDAQLDSLHQKIKAIEQEVQSKKETLSEKRSLGETKIEYATAMEQDALSKATTTQKEIRDLEIKLDQLEQLVVKAPRDGTIFRMPVAERGQLLKKGEPILTIVPEATQNAVELTVPGNDMPLVQVGQEVRLQFEGWPAVQFAGWPSVAVGTFGGTVTAVDPTDNGKGQFRILVTPNGKDEWPSDRYLRQGVRVNGWVMLKSVSLGYEIWRQLNGFPVIIADEEPGKKQSSKVPKLPK